MKEIVTQQKDGIFVLDREVDQLSVALGTSEHGGRVRGVSSKASWKDGFKEDAASYKKRDRYKEELVASCRAATLQECKMQDFLTETRNFSNALIGCKMRFLCPMSLAIQSMI